MKNLEHLTEEAVVRYRERASSRAELLAVQTHVLSCTQCRARLEQAVDANAAFLSLQKQMTGERISLNEEPEHLPYEQLALYLDNKLDEVEREIAESHLAICEECSGDLVDLRRYQTIAAAENTPPRTDAATEEAVITSPAAWPERRTASSPKTVSSWWRRLLAFDFFPAGGALVPAGVAAIIIAVLLLGVWLATRTRNKDEVASVEPVNQNAVAPTPVQSVKPAPVDRNVPNNTAAPASNQNSSGEQNNSPLVPLPRGSSQSPSANDAQTLALNDGGERVTFDNEGKIVGLESQPSSVREAVRRSLQAQRVQTPRSLETIAEGRSGVLMSGSAGTASNGVPFALLTPLGKVVRESQPTFRWRPLAGAKSYTVAVVDAKFRVVAQSPNLTDTSWTLSQALPRGANYSWQVTALQEDGTEVVSPASPAPQAKFRVLEQNSLDEVTRMENSGERSHLARGVIYAGAGLLDEARAEFEALVRDNPHSGTARRLLKSVKK
jgi:hypothetical protein